MGNFYPRPPRGGRPDTTDKSKQRMEFLSTPSARRATALAVHCAGRRAISIHALREEGDRSIRAEDGSSVQFLSTPSARRATACSKLSKNPKSDFYPRPPRGGRRQPGAPRPRAKKFLSTPSARRATYCMVLDLRRRFISIHALREEGDLDAAAVLCFDSTFLSTPSARRATAKTETKSLFSNKLYNILHEFRRALIYNGSKSYPNHAK